jgi:hypothetical protein
MSGTEAMKSARASFQARRIGVTIMLRYMNFDKKTTIGVF